MESGEVLYFSSGKLTMFYGRCNPHRWTAEFFCLHITLYDLSGHQLNNDENKQNAVLSIFILI